MIERLEAQKKLTANQWKLICTANVADLLDFFAIGDNGFPHTTQKTFCFHARLQIGNSMRVLCMMGRKKDEGEIRLAAQCREGRTRNLLGGGVCV